ncbi:MAG: hypothetical protein EBX44_08750, partial [Betaproteobacteria bacterium]|nr:hypothetical protein [Betaproteobacteria bacterium]
MISLASEAVFSCLKLCAASTGPKTSPEAIVEPRGTTPACTQQAPRSVAVKAVLVPSASRRASANPRRALASPKLA